MHQSSAPPSFKGTIFHTWKGNHPCRIYVADGQVYFIRRAATGISPGTAAVIGSQFGLLGGLAVGLAGAAKAKTQSDDFVRDDDPTPPQQLIKKHPENYSIPFADIVDSKIEPKGKHVSYGPNEGRWHFTRRGDAKETVVLLESQDDANQAVTLLGSLKGSGADQVDEMQSFTRLVEDQVPTEWRDVICEVRVAAPGAGRALEIVIANADRPDERRPMDDAAIYQAAMRLARKLSPSIRSFPGVSVEMKRLPEGGWQTFKK